MSKNDTHPTLRRRNNTHNAPNPTQETTPNPNIYNLDKNMSSPWYFRGDSRPPEQIWENTGISTIFANAIGLGTKEFKARETGPIKFHYHDKGGVKDIVSTTAVCLSKDWRSAAIFYGDMSDKAVQNTIK